MVRGASFRVSFLGDSLRFEESKIQRCLVDVSGSEVLVDIVCGTVVLYYCIGRYQQYGSTNDVRSRV